MKSEKLSTEIAALERKIKSAKNAVVKKVLEKKIETLRSELKKEEDGLSKLAKAKKKIREMSEKDFNEFIKMLSKKDGFAFLKSMTKDEIKRDIKREAKPVGWRFRGDNTKKPTRRDIREKNDVYYEGRRNRSDVSRAIKLAEGGGVGKPMFKIGDKVKIASDNDNENYDNFRDKVLTITHIATNEKQHEGYDSSMQGMALYDFKDVPFSLYEYEIEPKKIKGGKMEWGGTAESSETGEFIGGENQSSMYARGGHVSKGEMVWKKLKSSDKIQFLYENFTPEITPRGQEILVGKAWNFLPKNVKIKFEAKYANVENYGEGGGTGVSSESGTTIGGENQSSMFENGGVSTGFTYDIGGL